MKEFFKNAKGNNQEIDLECDISTDRFQARTRKLFNTCEPSFNVDFEMQVESLNDIEEYDFENEDIDYEESEEAFFVSSLEKID